MHKPEDVILIPGPYRQKREVTPKNGYNEENSRFRKGASMDLLFKIGFSRTEDFVTIVSRVRDESLLKQENN